MPDHGGVFVAAPGGQRVMLVVDEHGLVVPCADAGGLRGGDLAVLVAVGQEAEDSDFLPIALGLPVTDRYDTALPTRYWRAPAAVVSLLPAALRAILARRKQ